MSPDDETMTDDDLPATQPGASDDPEMDDDPVLAEYYRDLAEVNEAVANLYR
jgi:hypothetical protein